MPTLLQLTPVRPDLQGALQERYTVHRFDQVTDQAAWLAAHAGEVDAVVTGGGNGIAASLMKALPKLRIVAINGVGFDKVDLAAARAQGVRVTNTPDVLTDDVADLAVGLTIALLRRIPQANAHVRAGLWPQSERPLARKVSGKHFGILGLGRIGKEVAIRARAFGMEPVGYDIYWDDAFARQYGVRRAATLDEIFAVSDYLSLHTNLTPETRDLVGAKNIAKMKQGVLILNCARGEIVNTDDMVAALKSGRVGGYGTDVLDQEPPPPDHPLLHLPNCIVTPHVASRTFESVVRQATTSVQNLLNAARGEKPIAQVNPEVPVRPL